MDDSALRIRLDVIVVLQMALVCLVAGLTLVRGGSHAIQASASIAMLLIFFFVLTKAFLD